MTTATIAAAAGPSAAVVRAMPNTPALVGKGVSAITAGPGADDDDLEWAERILGSVGMTVRAPESQFDAVTGLTGSGPAYVFFVAEALIEAGVGGRARPGARRVDGGAVARRIGRVARRARRSGCHSARW